MSDWLTYSPTSGHGNGTITLTATTLTELNDRMETILALNSSDNLSASSVVTQTFMTPTSLTVDYVAWSTDISMYGGYGEKKNITYTVYANYDNGSSRDITNEVEVDGISDFVPSTTATSRTDVGSYGFVFEYRGIESSPVSVEMYQEAYTPLPPSHPVDKSEYLTFEIVSGGTFIFKDYEERTSTKTINYRINGGDWIEGESIPGFTLNVSAGDIIEFKGHEQLGYGNSVGIFKGTSYFDIYGNVMSLYNDFSSEEWAIGTYYYFDRLFCNSNVVDASGLYLPSPNNEERNAYYRLFQGCNKLLRAPSIKHILGENNITLMFSGCTALMQAPELPAVEKLDGIFKDCKSLISPPEIPSSVTNLFETFSGCTSLQYAPILQQRPLKLQRTFADCVSLTIEPLIPNYSNCYGMFMGCSSLTTIRNTNLQVQSAGRMYENCTSLTAGPSTIKIVRDPQSGYLWGDSLFKTFSGCTSLLTAPSLVIEKLVSQQCESMFAGCTSLTTAPDLPSAKLNTYAYSRMFSGCTSLNYIKCLATDISPTNCTKEWVSGVSPTGTFVKSPDMHDWTTGIDGIPTGWTVIDAT